MNKVFSIFYIVILAGCESISMTDLDKFDTMEASWQALHILDVAQTAHMNDGLCYQEGNMLTKELIGINPPDSRVYQWGLLSAVMHYFVFKWADNTFPNYSDNLRMTDLGYKAAIVGGNHEEGLRYDGAKPCEIINIDVPLAKF